MSETRLTIPSLYGGISKQPAAVRFPNQVQDSLNALFTVIDGCTKRPGSLFVLAPDLDTDADVRLHPIDRDGSEQYLVVYGPGVLRVFEIGGPEATVTIDTDAQTYLDLNTPTAAQLRLVSIADYTLILNTTVEVAATRSPDYDITKVHRDFASMVSYTPAIDTYHKVKDNEVASAENYQYAPDEDATFAVMKMAEVTLGYARAKGVYDDAGNNPGGFKIAFQKINMDLTGVSWTTATKTLTKANAFDDYTFTTGDQIYVTGGTNVTAGWYTIASKTNGDSLVLESEITSPAGDQSDVVTDSIGNEYEVTIDIPAHNYDDMEDIAAEFQRALQEAGAEDALISWVNTPGKSKAGHFEITSPIRGSDAAIFEPTAPATIYDYTAANQGFATVATNTAGTGTAVNEKQTPEERWIPVAAPNQSEAQIDATLMPVQLVRTSYTGDGSTPATFTVSLVDWKDRTSGGPTSNPVPALWKDHKKISDITLHRNRLVLAGDEHVVMSQADDLFNFYIDNSDNVVDSDPIERTLGSSNITIIDHMVEFRQSLFITTKAASQYELNAPEALTPNTAAFTSTTSYKTQSVRPVMMGAFLYFVGVGQDDSTVFEYFWEESRASNYAADITAHVRGLLPSSIDRVVSIPNHNTLYVLKSGEYKIYHHRLHWGAQQKEQSAWSIYQLTDHHEVSDIAALGDDLYVLSQVSEGWVIEKIPSARDLAESGSEYAVHLDRKRTLLGVYDSGADTTTWSWSESDSSVNMIVLGTGFGDDAGAVLSVVSNYDFDTLTYDDWDALTYNDLWRLPWDYHLMGVDNPEAELTPVDASSIQATGDYSGSTVIAGNAYIFQTQLTRPYYRGQDNVPDTDAWINVYEITTTHHETGPYSIMVEAPRRRRRIKDFTPPTGSLTQRKGTHKAFFNGEADDMDIYIEDAGPKPVTATAVEFIVDYEPRRG